MRPTQQIAKLEREMASCWCEPPYVLLMSIPGINVVTAAEFAGEMGPITTTPMTRLSPAEPGSIPHATRATRSTARRPPGVPQPTAACAA